MSVVDGASVSVLQDVQTTPIKEESSKTELTEQQAPSSESSQVTRNDEAKTVLEATNDETKTILEATNDETKTILEATNDETKTPANTSEVTKEERKSPINILDDIAPEKTLQVSTTQSDDNVLTQTDDKLPSVEIHNSTLVPVPEANISETQSDSSTKKSISLHAEPTTFLKPENRNSALTEEISPEISSSHVNEESTNEITVEPSAPILAISESANQIVDSSHVTDLANESVVPSAPALMAFSETVQLAPREAARNVEGVKGVEDVEVSEERLLYPRLDSILQGM